jgi:hypothetical protein
MAAAEQRVQPASLGDGAVQGKNRLGSLVDVTIADDIRTGIPTVPKIWPKFASRFRKVKSTPPRVSQKASATQNSQTETTIIPKSQILPVVRLQNPLQQLVNLRFTSRLGLEAHYEAQFTNEEEQRDCEEKVRGLWQYIDQRGSLLFRDQPMRSIQMRLVSVSDKDHPSTALKYICIRGIPSEHEISHLHRQLSKSSVRKIYKPLKICYDTSLIFKAAAAAEEPEGAIEDMSMADYTLSGKLIRATRGSNYSISTIGLILRIDDRLLLLTTSHPATEDDSVVHSVSPEDLRDEEFNADADSNEALVVDSWKWDTENNGIDQGNPSTTDSDTIQGLGSTQSTSSSVAIGNPVASGSDWALYSIPQHLYRPNVLVIAGERRHVTSPSSNYSRCEVIINAGRSGIVKGMLLSGLDYIKLKDTEKSMECLTIRLLPGSSRSFLESILFDANPESNSTW